MMRDKPVTLLFILVAILTAVYLHKRATAGTPDRIARRRLFDANGNPTDIVAPSTQQQATGYLGNVKVGEPSPPIPVPIPFKPELPQPQLVPMPGSGQSILSP